MTIIIYQNAFGRNYTFQLLEKDGVTSRNLTGLTLTARFKDMNTPTTLASLACVVTDAANGYFYWTLTTAISGTYPKTWIMQIEVSQSGVLLDPSEEEIIVVRKSAAVAG